jgi:multiple sugar transport system ATP-binding protein
MHVTLSNIYKSFGEVEVVKGLSLEIEDGEFLVLLGPSGCGKTTALRMIAGLETVTSGRILIGNRDVTEVLPKYRDVAMVFQSYALYPHMTVAENIGYPLKLRSVVRADRDRQVREAAAKVHLQEFLDRLPRQLSGGQRQRVALARAIVRRPSLFLMDEPLSNLDAKLRGNMRSELKRLQNDLGVTTIYVTHDQVEAMTLAHRVAVMNKGVVQQTGEPRQIYDDPGNLFVAGFIGSPPMNMVRGSLRQGFFVKGERRIRTGVCASAAHAILAIHPEECRIRNPEDGDLRGEIYTTELIGDHTLVTATVGEDTLAIKATKDFDAPIGSSIGLEFPRDKQLVFDADSGDRIR